jgi:hypothetical protein
MDVYARRRLVALLSVAAVVLIIIVAVASGGSGDDSSDIPPVEQPGGGTGNSLSKADYIQQADQICAETEAAIANLGAGAAADDAVLQADQQYQYVRSELDQLRTLSPPTEDKADLQRFYAALQNQVKVLSRQKQATQQADQTALAEVSTDLAAAESQVRSTAAAYGLKKCGKEGTPTTSNTGAATSPTGGATATPTPTPTPSQTVTPTPTPTPTPTAPPADTGTGGTVGGAPPPTDTGGDTGGGGTGGGTGGTGGSGGIGAG